MSVAVVKLGVGNTASLLFALERLGADACLTDDPAIIGDSERIILPGVGAAAAAMRRVDRLGLREVLQQFSRPLLGICLGMQLLYHGSDEGDADGLARLAGRAARLPSRRDLPVPHMGWTKVAPRARHALTEGVQDGDYFYFVHSYACPANDEALATALYGEDFAAIAGRGLAFGCQFHPERSGAAGARILANFLRLPC